MKRTTAPAVDAVAAARRRYEVASADYNAAFRAWEADDLRAGTEAERLVQIADNRFRAARTAYRAALAASGR